MADTTSPVPSAKRVKVKGNASKSLTRDIPSNESSALIELYKGPEVTVIVQDKKFNLPKRLLCHSSSVFDRAFNGAIMEGQAQEVTLQSTTVEAFELVIKWIFNGILVLPAECNKNEDIVTQIIGFFKLADHLSLAGPFNRPLDRIKFILVTNRNTLTSEHLRSVFDLPRGHPLRVLVMRACVTLYIVSTRTSDGSAPPFKFRQELNDLPGFEADMFRYYDEILRTKVKTQFNNCVDWSVIDPLTGTRIIYT